MSFDKIAYKALVLATIISHPAFAASSDEPMEGMVPSRRTTPQITLETPDHQILPNIATLPIRYPHPLDEISCAINQHSRILASPPSVSLPPCSFSDLPPELILHILSFLQSKIFTSFDHIKTIIHFGLSCKLFYELAPKAISELRLPTPSLHSQQTPISFPLSGTIKHSFPFLKKLTCYMDSFCEDMKNLRKLKDLTINTRLQVDHVQVSPQFCEILANVIKNCPLTSLCITNLNLGPEGGAAIAEGLKQNTTLGSLSLSQNNLGSKGGAAIAEALKVNTIVSKLTLIINDLGPEGGKAIADALKQNSTLSSLNLSTNGLADQAGIAFAEALKVNKSLTSLMLISNNISKEGIMALADSVRHNETLKELDIRLNGTRAQKEEIMSHLKELGMHNSISILF